MKKINNKGFTLVELLTVIVILAIIITIAVPASLSISHKIKKNMCEKKIEMIESAARLYGQDNPSEIGSGGKTVKVKVLMQEGYIKKDDEDTNGNVINPFDDKPMNDLEVTITKSNRRYNATLNRTNSDGNDICGKK